MFVRNGRSSEGKAARCLVKMAKAARCSLEMAGHCSRRKITITLVPRCYWSSSLSTPAGTVRAASGNFSSPPLPPPSCPPSLSSPPSCPSPQSSPPSCSSPLSSPRSCRSPLSSVFDSSVLQSPASCPPDSYFSSKRARVQRALRQRLSVQSSCAAGSRSSAPSSLCGPIASGGAAEVIGGRDTACCTKASPASRWSWMPAHAASQTFLLDRPSSSEPAECSLQDHPLRTSSHTCFPPLSLCSRWLADRPETFLKAYAHSAQRQRCPSHRRQQGEWPRKLPLVWQQHSSYYARELGGRRQQRPWEQWCWRQQQQRRWYTPPSRRTWSKQHAQIYTRRPLTHNFALGRLHPECEWWRERTAQPVSLFMGFPDLEKIHVRGGATYINEMDAPTLSVVLAALGCQGRTSAASPPHLLQHNSSLIAQLGSRAAALAATASDPTLAYLFRGCAAAGVSDWANVCTLAGYVDTRLPRFSVHDVIVVLQGVRLARAGTLQHYAEDEDVDRPPLSPVYVHPPFVDRVVGHLELLLQHRDDVLPAEICAAAAVLAGLGYASAARLQFLSGLLAQVPQQQLALTPPGGLAAAMEVFARFRDALNTDLSIQSCEMMHWRALPPLLQAAATRPGCPPSCSQLTLVYLVAPLLHRLQRETAGGNTSGGRNGSRASKSCRAGGAPPAAASGAAPAAAAVKSLSEAAATAAAAVAEERSEVRRRGSLLRHAAGVCLAWAYDHLEDLSVHHISKVMYAAAAARLCPAAPVTEALLKISLEQLDACTPADLSRLLYAVLHADELRSAADSILRQARAPIQQALEDSLELCSSSTLVRVHSAIASVLARVTQAPTALSLRGARPAKRSPPMSDEQLASLRNLAEKGGLYLSSRLCRVRPGDLATFLVGLRSVGCGNREGVAEQVFDTLNPCLEVLEPAQLASLLAVVADSPQHHGHRWRKITSRLVASLELSLGRRQHWQPETYLQVLLSLGKLPKEWRAPVHSFAVAVCDRLAGAEPPRYKDSGSHEGQDLADVASGDCDTLCDAFDGSLSAITNHGMPLDELQPFRCRTSPLLWLKVIHYKQLINALEGLQVRHKLLRQQLAHSLELKRHDLTKMSPA